MKKVLLASASSIFLNKNRDLLTGRGFEIFTARSGYDVFQVLEEHLFDLIFSDFKLEDMGGCTLCSLIRREQALRRIPVILACYNFPGSIKRVEQSGASAMLVKPVEPDQLIETVSSFIELPIERSKRIELSVKVFSRKEGLEFFCFSHDVSTTGILLETEHNLSLGSRIICHFTLPDSCHIETEGEVIRCMSNLDFKNFYGIKFIGLTMFCRSAIDNYVAQIIKSGSFHRLHPPAVNSRINYRPEVTV